MDVLTFGNRIPFEIGQEIYRKYHKSQMDQVLKILKTQSKISKRRKNINKFINSLDFLDIQQGDTIRHRMTMAGFDTETVWILMNDIVSQRKNIYFDIICVNPKKYVVQVRCVKCGKRRNGPTAFANPKNLDRVKYHTMMPFYCKECFADFKDGSKGYLLNLYLLGNVK